MTMTVTIINGIIALVNGNDDTNRFKQNYHDCDGGNH